MEAPDRLFLIYIAASPERVWQALHDTAASPGWFFGRRMELPGSVGDGFGIFSPDGGKEVWGEVLAREPNHRLLLSWKDSHSGFENIRIEFLIEHVGEVTKLTVQEYHGGNVIPEAFLKSGREGWSLILSGLKTLLETGSPLPPVEVKPPQD